MAKRTVLLVEDSDAVRCTFAALLDGDGHQVIEARTLAEARAFLAASIVDDAGRRGFDVAIVDQHLPDGHGTALSAEIRRHHPGVAIILMSGADLGIPVETIDLVVDKSRAPDQVMALAEDVIAVRRAEQRR